MKKIIKKIINKIISLATGVFALTNFGRFSLYILNKNIIEKKKIINHKNLKLEFYTPNRLSFFRVKTFSTKEPETLDWIDQFQENKIFWDVGANIGLYSCYAAKKKLCKVYAFEPSIFNLEWLGRNIFLNNLTDKIVVLPIPLTNKISENRLNFS